MHFEAIFANPNELEEKDHLEGHVIKEEDEDDDCEYQTEEQSIEFEAFKKALKIKSKYAIFNDDEDADKPYIPVSTDVGYS